MQFSTFLWIKTNVKDDPQSQKFVNNFFITRNAVNQSHARQVSYFLLPAMVFEFYLFTKDSKILEKRMGNDGN